MLRHLSLVVVASLVGAGVCLAQTPTKKEAPKPNEVEIRFTDGSTLRVLMLQENVEITTRYGKLTVPIDQVRRIDFGFRMPDEVTKKIEDAVKKLGDDNYDQREAAVKELVALGAYAYPALQQAAKGSDAETVRRARQALEQIREKVPAERLKLPAHDQIISAEFPIIGRIASSSIKVKTSYFGDQELKVADLRSVRWVAGGGEHAVSVDSAKFGSPPGQWMDTDIHINPNENLLITALGTVDLWPQQPGGYMTKPSGYGAGGGVGLGQRHLPGMLLGRIGENGKIFPIGERFEGVPTEEGKLYLHIGVSPWGGPSTGTYEVKISSGNSAALGR